MLRWPVMVPLNEVRGAVNGAGIAAPRAGAVDPVRQYAGRVRQQPRELDRPLGDADAGRRRTMSRSRGRRSGASLRPRLAIGGAPGSRLHSSETRLAPLTPSTVAWCILVITAIGAVVEALDHPQLPQRPAAVQRLMPAMSPHTSASSRAPPGAGTAIRRTWCSMSKSSSSTQIGWSRFSSGSWSLRMNAGLSSSRAAQGVPDGGEAVVAGHGGRIENEQAAHVHQVRRRLEVEEARVEPAQPVHAAHR